MRRHAVRLGLLALCTALVAAACAGVGVGLSFDIPLTQAPEAREAPGPVARIVQSGAIDCFPQGTKGHDGSPGTCEVSAAAIVGDRVILASDKPAPTADRSAVFSYPWEGTLPRETDPAKNAYFTAAPFLTAAKYEDMAVTPDGSYVFLATGFDRVDPASPKLDAYNTLLFWPAGREKDASVVGASERGGVTSSLDLRRTLSRLQKTDAFPDGLPYFKNEGLAAPPGDRLLFGVREAGKNYNEFTYMIRIVSVPYLIRDCHVILGDGAKIVYDMTGAELARRAGLPELLGLSSLTYDKYHARLYMLTTFEISQTEPINGGYLWVMSMDALSSGGLPALVRTPDGAPLKFGHKPEAVTVINGDSLLVVHDDDRVVGQPPTIDPGKGPKRALHQSFYDIVRFE